MTRDSAELDIVGLARKATASRWVRMVSACAKHPKACPSCCPHPVPSGVSRSASTSAAASPSTCDGGCRIDAVTSIDQLLYSAHVEVVTVSAATAS